MQHLERENKSSILHGWLKIIWKKWQRTFDGLLKTVKAFGDDIGMTLGLDKCVKETFIWRKLKYISSIVLDTNTKIKELDQEEAHKYLGIEEGDGIQHGKMKEKIRKECYRRVRGVQQA